METIQRQYRPIEPKKAPGLKKAILVILTPIEKVCDFMVKRPWMSLIILFGGIILIGHLVSVRVAGIMAFSLLILFTIINIVEKHLSDTQEVDDGFPIQGLPDSLFPPYTGDRKEE